MGSPTFVQLQGLDALQDIAVQLIETRNLHELLKVILEKAMQIACCDAGSLYLKKDEHQLVFEVAINRSVTFSFSNRETLIQGSGLAAFSFRSGTPLMVEDVYKIPPGSAFEFNKRFDNESGYRTRSVYVQPLKSSKNEKLGVLQLINKKYEASAPWPSKDPWAFEKMPSFGEEDRRFLESFASLASAAIENARLYENIQNLFKSFVHVSVKAIESRDPITRGHSERVACLVSDFAEKLNHRKDGKFGLLRFGPAEIDELRFAALLHDFGKIGVKETTLLKSEKLYPHAKQSILHRIERLSYLNEIKVRQRFIQTLIEKHQKPSAEDLEPLEKELKTFRTKMNDLQTTILELNRPTVLTEDKKKLLESLAGLSFEEQDGQKNSFLSEEEVRCLSISRGSLSEIERQEIESHVSHTYEFLRGIPWSPDLEKIPEIAYAHHEKLDGSGYPRKIKAELIPVQSRILTICDIYDALVAPDRPYKASVPLEKAMAILSQEVKAGKLDADLFKVFEEERVFEVTQDSSLTLQAA